MLLPGVAFPRISFARIGLFLLLALGFAPARQASAAAIRTSVRPPASRVPVRTVQFRSLLQPTFTTCGQTSVAMITGVDVKTVVNMVGTDRGTNAEQLVSALRRLKPQLAPKIVQLHGRNPANNSIVSLIDPTSGGRHWTVFHNGAYYDPIFGKVNDYPSWVRKQFAIAVNG